MRGGFGFQMSCKTQQKCVSYVNVLTICISNFVLYIYNFFTRNLKNIDKNVHVFVQSYEHIVTGCIGPDEAFWKQYI